MYVDSRVWVCGLSTRAQMRYNIIYWVHICRKDCMPPWDGHHQTQCLQPAGRRWIFSHLHVYQALCVVWACLVNGLCWPLILWPFRRPASTSTYEHHQSFVVPICVHISAYYALTLLSEWVPSLSPIWRLCVVCVFRQFGNASGRGTCFSPFLPRNGPRNLYCSKISTSQ